MSLILDQTATNNAAPPSGLRGAALVGSATIILTIGVGFTWAAFAPLASASMAPGFVSVSSNRKAVQHLEGGIVSEILAHDGAHVEAGQVIVRIDDSKARAQLQILQDELDSHQALEARLLAERDKLAAINFPKELLASRRPSALEAIRGQNLMFETRQTALEGQREILIQRTVQLRKEIEGYEALQRANTEQMKIAQSQLRDLSGLMEKGHATRTRVLELEREVATLKGEHGQLLSQIAKAEQQIGEANLQILQTRRQFNEDVAASLRETQEKIAGARERITASQDTFQRLDIQAPASGTVVSSTVHTRGAVIAPGQTLMEIVPEGDDLIIEAHVGPNDIDSVSAGLNAKVHFTAFKQRNASDIHGYVEQVSADRLIDKATNQPYYLARITLPQEEREKLQGKKIIPGMAAQVTIQTGSRTLFEYLIEPIQDSLDQALKEE